MMLITVIIISNVLEYRALKSKINFRDDLTQFDGYEQALMNFSISNNLHNELKLPDHFFAILKLLPAFTYNSAASSFLEDPLKI